MSAMTEVERLVIRLMGDKSGYTSTLKAAIKETEIAAKEIDTAGMSVREVFKTANAEIANLGSQITTIGAGITGVGVLLTGVFGGIATAGVMAAGKFEQTTIAFETMLGSASETEKLLEDLTTFAAKTPFEMPEIEQAARGLVMFGERGDELMETLNILGNAAAGTSTNFGDLALIFNQVRGAGKLLTQDFRQLSTRGVISLQDFADHFDITTEAAQAMLSSGKIGFDDLRAVLASLSQEGGRFANLMEKQSTSLLGLVSTLKDAVNIAARELGQELAPAVKEVVQTLLGWAEAYRELDPAFKSISAYTVGFLAVSGVLLTVLGGTVIVVGQMVTGYAALTAAAVTSTAAQWGLVAVNTALQASLIGLGAGALIGLAYALGELVYVGTDYNATLAESKSLTDQLVAIESKRTGELVKQIDALQGVAREKALAEGLGEATKHAEAMNEEVARTKKDLEGLSAFDWGWDAAVSSYEEAKKRSEEAQKALKTLQDLAAKDEVKKKEGGTEGGPMAKEIKAMEKYVADLKLQADTFGMTARQAAIYKAEQEGIKKELIDQMKIADQVLTQKEQEKKLADEAKAGADKQNQAKEAYELAAAEKATAARLAEKNKVMQEGKRIMEQYLTPTEKYQRELKEIDKLEKMGAFKEFPAAAQRARDAAKKELEGSDLKLKVKVEFPDNNAIRAGTADFRRMLADADARAQASMMASTSKEVAKAAPTKAKSLADAELNFRMSHPLGSGPQGPLPLPGPTQTQVGDIGGGGDKLTKMLTYLERIALAEEERADQVVIASTASLTDG